MKKFFLASKLESEVDQLELQDTDSGKLPAVPSISWQSGYAESFHSEVRDEFLSREGIPQRTAGHGHGCALEGGVQNPTPAQFSGNHRTPAESAATCERYVPIDEDLLDPSFSV